jgi:hypothetical protein
MDIAPFEESYLQLTTGGSFVDTDIPYDYFECYRRTSQFHAEVALYLALLETGIDDYCRYLGDRTRRGQRLFKEAEAWFFTGGDDWYCSFENVCAVLSLEPDYVRRGLRHYQQARLNLHYRPDIRPRIGKNAS